MKPETVAHQGLNTGQSKSLYSRYNMPGRKEIKERESLFKAPHCAVNIRKSYLSQSRGIPKPIKNGLNSTRSYHVYNGVNTKQSETKSKILRPKIDMLAARKRMLERTLHLKQNSRNNIEQKNSGIKDDNIMQKLNLTCTPKQSALTKVYLKLAESAKKSAKSRSLFPAIPKSPVTEKEILQGENNLNSTATVNNSFVSKNQVQSEKHLIPCNLKADRNEESFLATHLAIPESTEETSINVPDFSGRTNIKNNGNQSSGNCALNNILKHCQLYWSKISSIIDAVTYLDDSFQRVVAGEIGGNVYSNFCEYQKKKLDLYREMKVIEEELEDAVRSEIDVQAKFKDYLRKKVNIWKEESDLLEEFKSTINCIINQYEEEIVKPPDYTSLNELVQMLSSPTDSEKDACSDKPVLRRSQRLLTPKQGQANKKNCRASSNNSKKNLKDDDLIIKRKSKSNGKKSIQHSIYKDLQKSFNLYSPECSFSAD